MKDEGFKEFVEDQLRGLGRVEARAMFGGYGLYCQRIFFGIIYRGELFFKTDARTRPDYVAARMVPFRPNATQILTSYYEVPATVLEDPDEAVAWARRAIACRRTGRRGS